MNAFDVTWEDIHAKQEWGKYPSEHVIRFVARNFYKYDKRNEIRILDFGCGAGANTWFLARERFDTYAFDGSNSAIERVRKRLEDENLKADLRVIDGVSIDYKDDYFDSVIDNVCSYANTLDHIIVMYEQMYRVLKRGGLLYSSVFSTKTTGFGLGEEIENHTYRNIKKGCLEGRGIAHFYDEMEISDVIKKVGFKNILIDPLEYKDNGSIVSMYLVKAEK